MNKLIKLFFLSSLLTSLPLLYFGCDDAGVVTSNPVSVFSHTNLPQLPASENATYEMFVSFGDGAISNYCSMGKFLISASGQAVDDKGAPMDFKFKFTPDMSKAVDCILTMEPIPDNDTLPNGPIIMGGIKTLVSNMYVFNLNMMYKSVIGSVAIQLPSDSVKFILAAPTASYSSSQFNRGVWFTTDSTGSNPGISCSCMPDSLGWTYHAYVIDTRDSINGVYNIGKFQYPNQADDYSACNGIGGGQQWGKPGQDWLQSGCPGTGLHDIDGTPQYSLNNGFYKLLITLEPKSRTATAPFFLRIFYGSIPAGLTYNSASVLNNVSANYMPHGDISITSSNTQK